MFIALAMALVPPCIYDEKNEDYKPQDKENERSRPILPELLQAICNVIRLHAAANLHLRPEIGNLEICIQ
jgi:hypothetical protein